MCVRGCGTVEEGFGVCFVDARRWSSLVGCSRRLDGRKGLEEALGTRVGAKAKKQRGSRGD